MERKNENDFLKLKNYSIFLLDIGLDVFFSQKNDTRVERSKFDGKYISIEDIDNYIEKWQIKNGFQLILRNKNISSKNILLLSERSAFINFDQPKKNQNYWIKCFFQLDKTLMNFLSLTLIWRN